MLLNLGCGYEPMADAVNHDRTRHSDYVDVAHDLNIHPWPWEDCSAAAVQAVDLLEHLDDFIGFFDEAWRVLETGGRIRVRVPRYDNINVHIDPTHKRGYHPQSFDYLDPDTHWGSKYGMYTTRKWRKISLQDGNNITVILAVRK